MVFRRKALIALVFVSVLGGTIAAIMLTPNRFVSTLKILVKNERADLIVTPDQGDVFNDRPQVDEDAINTEIELINSQDLLTEVVRLTNLHRLDPPQSESEEVRVERAVRRLRANLDIHAVRKTRIIEVNYSDPEPAVASGVLETLADLYLAKHLEVHKTPGAYRFFQSQSTRFLSELQSTEAALSDFQATWQLVSVEGQQGLLLEKLLDVESKRMASEATIQALTQRVAEVESLFTGTPRRIQTQSRSADRTYLVQELTTMLVELENKRTQLLTKYNPGQRLVLEVEEQIGVTRKALTKAELGTADDEVTDVNPLYHRLESELAEARFELSAETARVKELRGQAVSYREDLRRLEKLRNRHSALLRKVEQSKQSYQLYKTREEEARISELLDERKISNVAIAEKPATPVLANPSAPALTLALGLLLASLLSFGGALVADRMAGVVRTPRDIENLAELPVLATVPSVPESMPFRMEE